MGGLMNLLCFKEKEVQYVQGQDCFIDYTPNGVSEPFKHLNFIVYPVPQYAGGEINIKLGSQMEVNYKLTGVDGIEYASGILQSGSHSFKLPDKIPAGVYFLKLGAAKTSWQIHKIIIL
ncbi:MAG: T9SS type A sorting domain-containing protein [Ignavibacteria bacterium]|nr:T9SS type A sorting domain-containing protein [Ignavibacteria bacterium]